jgi:hypothetical protein
MPILSDIEFDKNGAMILGFMDRGGLMFGNGNYPPTGTSPLHQYNVSGDLLRACSNGAGWTLESGGACGGITAGGANAEGPGGGEYYTGDNFKIHKETIMGGIAQHPATDEITVVTMDPLKSVDAGGVRWISHTTGKDTRGLQLYQGGPNNPSNGTFGKGVGLGDVEILCDPAPLEIGNYVWVDTDADGIQDPNEAPIPNVTLELWNNGVKVGETQTDAKGEYYFGGASDKGMLGGNHLLPYHDYEIRLPLNDPDIPANHVPTVMNQGTDVHDSDGDNEGIHAGYSTIKLTTGKAGENVGILLRGTERDGVERGQVLAKPGSITPHTKFEAQIYVLTKEEGGRHTPFFKGYRPQFYVRTTDVTGAVELPADVEMVMPGDDLSISVELISPVAMEEGMNFAIREGGRTVGSGVVSKIIE